MLERNFAVKINSQTEKILDLMGVVETPHMITTNKCAAME